MVPPGWITAGPELPEVPVDPPVDVFGVSVVVVPFALTCTSSPEFLTSTGDGDPAHRHPATPGAKLGLPLGVLGQVTGGTTGGADGAPVGISGDVGTVGVEDAPVEPADGGACDAVGLGVGVGVGSGVDSPPPPPPLVVKETTEPLDVPTTFVADTR